jgi:sodium-dependent dicarboxylate transporter 2/3/5
MPSSDAPKLVARAGLVGGLLLFTLMLAAPVPTGMPPAAYRLAAVTALMAVFWLSEAIPMAAASLLPLVLYPLLGIQPADEISGAYLDQNVFLYLGGFVIALGIEKWGLHRRMALHIVRVVGCSPRRIVLGFMLATGFLSMWISNTASTMLMFPIALALLASMADLVADNLEPQDDIRPDAESLLQSHPTLSRLSIALLLGTAYAASIGGLSTIVGTPTNVTMVGIWEKHPDLTATYGTFSMGTWIACFLPLAALMTLAAWLVLTRGMKPLPHDERLGGGFFRDRLRSLGKPSVGERMMLAVFAATAALWIFRVPLQFGDVTVLPGWGPPVQEFIVHSLQAGEEFASGAPVHDSTVAMLMAVLLFLLPGGRDEAGSMQPLMDWETVQHRVPWGILLLIGGGLAMADAFGATGLSKWIGERFVDHAGDLSPLMLVALVCLLLTFLTEFTSNVATVSTLAPILIAASLQLKVDPRLILVPATISASCAFMLPIATPPNAIVFSSGRIRMWEMMREGFILNLIGVVLVTATTFLLVCPLMGIEL